LLLVVSAPSPFFLTSHMVQIFFILFLRYFFICVCYPPVFNFLPPQPSRRAGGHPFSLTTAQVLHFFLIPPPFCMRRNICFLLSTIFADRNRQTPKAPRLCLSTVARHPDFLSFRLLFCWSTQQYGIHLFVPSLHQTHPPPPPPPPPPPRFLPSLPLT